MKGKIFIPDQLYLSNVVASYTCLLRASPEMCAKLHISLLNILHSLKMIQKTSVERWTLHTFNEHCIRDVADVA